MEYSLCDTKLSMLKLLKRLLEEARARDEDVLWLAFYRRGGGGDRSRLEVQETRLDIADTLDLTGAEAIGLQTPH